MERKGLTKAAILGQPDLGREFVEVPEWEGGVWIRGLTGTERDAFEASLFAEKGGARSANLANLRARLVVLTAVDANGVRLFADGDAEALGEKSAKALDRLFTIAQRLNGLTDGDVEALAKN
jgi:hypothetical protein